MLVPLVLLAGNSTRMGEPKQHVKLLGKTFLEHVIERLESNKNKFDKMIFVGQEKDKKAQEVVEHFGGIWKINKNPEEGPLSSIRIGLNYLREKKPILLWPVDHPLVSKETLRELIDKWSLDKKKIVVPSDGKRRGHPTIFPEWAYESFFKADMNVGAKQILDNNFNSIQYLVTDDPWIRANLNNKEMLKKAEAFYKD